MVSRRVSFGRGVHHFRCVQDIIAQLGGMGAQLGNDTMHSGGTVVLGWVAMFLVLLWLEWDGDGGVVVE